MLDEEVLFDIYSNFYHNLVIEKVRTSYMPDEMVKRFKGGNEVPLTFDVTTSTMHVGLLPEQSATMPDQIDGVNIKTHYITIYDYVKQYRKLFGDPSFLLPIPPKTLFDFIVEEAISLGASDITISPRLDGVRVFYQVRKRKIYSKRSVTKEDVKAIISVAAYDGNNTAAEGDRKPKYFGLNLTDRYRGRAAIARTFYGDSLTIRILENALFDRSMESLNIEPRTREFVRKVFLSREYGLRLMIGATESGKNTTIMSALSEKAGWRDSKIVSVEMPVELQVDFMEQIDCQSEEEYSLAVTSLLRQNPDLVYITEIMDLTAKSALKVANTGKEVYSTIHANSISEVIPRIQDMCGMSLDRIILSLQSCIFQSLERNEEEDKVYPFTYCVHFNQELKDKLLGKSLGEVVRIIREEEDKWKQGSLEVETYA